MLHYNRQPQMTEFSFCGKQHQLDSFYKPPQDKLPFITLTEKKILLTNAPSNSFFDFSDYGMCRKKFVAKINKIPRLCQQLYHYCFVIINYFTNRQDVIDCPYSQMTDDDQGQLYIIVTTVCNGIPQSIMIYLLPAQKPNIYLSIN